MQDQWHDPNLLAQANSPATPTKLFREPAATGSVSCLGCGGPITLHGFGAVEQVSCPYCGSTLGIGDSKELELLNHVARARQQSVLPLQVKGEFEGSVFEIIGVIWRQTSYEGVTYPWQEFLLYNPFKGYRWLVYTVFDGHWQLGRALDGLPLPGGGIHSGNPTYQDKTYKHFQTSYGAVVTYVEGEFPWRVEVGDTVTMSDFVAPPFGLSCEQNDEEITYSSSVWISGADVWKAFKAPGSPPPSSGVAPLSPNHHAKHGTFFAIAVPIMLVLWAALSFRECTSHANHVAYERTGIPFTEVLSDELTITHPGTVRLEFAARPLSNNWGYGEAMLVNAETEEAFVIGAEASEYAGVSDGESWSEIDNPGSALAGGVPAGKYFIQLAAQTDPAASAPPATYDVRVYEDVGTYRYVILPFFFIFLVPAIWLMLYVIFEFRRWSTSDHAISFESDDD